MAFIIDGASPKKVNPQTAHEFNLLVIDILRHMTDLQDKAMELAQQADPDEAKYVEMVEAIVDSMSGGIEDRIIPFVHIYHALAVAFERLTAQYADAVVAAQETGRKLKEQGWDKQ